ELTGGARSVLIGVFIGNSTRRRLYRVAGGITFCSGRLGRDPADSKVGRYAVGPEDSGEMAKPVHLPVQQGYDAWARVYDTEGNPLVALEGPVVRGWLGGVAGRRVADVGCGTGRHAVWLAQAGAQVVALDLSDGMMSRAVAKAGAGRVHFCYYRVPEPLPLADGSCDYVIFALVADHVQQLEAAFGEFARVLVSGGQVILSVVHPAMNLAGITARFFDPDTGDEVRVAAFEHSIADYVNAALAGGLTLAEMVERKATEELAQNAPRAAKYLGWPMLLALRLIKPAVS
ncbi:MAG: class I SAM-dependent methyltransferase, partial [Planctomycetota bacterium]